MKKIKINENCIGCGACTAIAPEYFEFNDEGYAQAKKEIVEQKDLNDVEEAVEGCPVSAIEIVEEKDLKDIEKTVENCQVSNNKAA